MSIHNITNKIKSLTIADPTRLIYPVIIIGVGICSFGLGRLSTYQSNNLQGEGNIVIIEKDNLLQNDSEEIAYTNEKDLEKKFVASKNGKMYYPKGCGAASRIKTENEVWFSTEDEALKSGYQRSSSCK